MPQARVALDARLADAPFAGPAATAASAPPDAARARRIVRLAVDAGSLSMDERASGRFDSLDARLAWYRARNVDVWLALENLPLGAASLADARAAAAEANRRRALAGRAERRANGVRASTSRADADSQAPRAPAAADAVPPPEADAVPSRAAAAAPRDAADAPAPAEAASGAATVSPAGADRARSSGTQSTDARPSSLARLVRALASRLGDHVRIVELTLPRDSREPAAVAFDVKTLAIELHAARPSLAVAVGAPPEASGGARAALASLYPTDLAPYVDALVIDSSPIAGAASAHRGGAVARRSAPAGGVFLDPMHHGPALDAPEAGEPPLWPEPAQPPAQAQAERSAPAPETRPRTSADEDDASAARVREARAWLDKVDPTARVLERGVPLPSAGADAARRFTVAALWRLGGGAALTAFHAPTLDAARAVMRQADTLHALLEGEITALDPNVANLTLAPSSWPSDRASAAPGESPAGESAAPTPVQPRPADRSGMDSAPEAEGRATPQTATSGSPRYTLVYNLTTFNTYLIYAASPDPRPASMRAGTPIGRAAPGAPDPGSRAAATDRSSASATTAVHVSLTIATPARPTILDPDTGRSTPVQRFARDESARRTTFVAPLRERPLVIDFNDAVEGLVTERSDVRGLAELSVEEIVARHQQRQAGQDAAVRRYTAAVRMEQHFRPTAADAGYDVVTENRFFVDDESVEWEELSFSVNGAKWTANRPAFPLLQPEKVLSVPLKLRLTADYRYRLAGRATIDGHDCYVVHFEPLDPGRSLYRGSVWIDARTFVRRKLQTVQTNLVAPVVSNEETHEFIEVPLPPSPPAVNANGDAPPQPTALLPSKVSARQILLIAGRNVLLEKITTFAEYRINDAQFTAQRDAARASERIMYRDTDRGVRYLVKQGEAGERVVSEQLTARAKAMAMGVNIDPSYDFPLPILGINYLDFAFRGPDSQLAILFGGVLALGNIQRPRLFGTTLDGSIDFFAIAVPGNDRTYDAEGVRKQDELLTWPLSAGLNLGYQFTNFQKLTGQYQFQFNGYLKNRETTADYHVPSSTVTNGVGLAYEYRRAGYSFVANGTWYGRLRWKPWGQADALQTTPRTYTKYSVNLSKDWYVGLVHKVHVNGAWFGGRHLDRFSQYQFGMFDDTRVHGVPAAGVRYGELAMARGSYSFNLFEQYRFDLFLEQVFARDPAAGVSASPARAGALALLPEADRERWDRITGVGVAFTVKAPFDTLLRADVGKAFLPDRYRATGSTVVSVLFLKPL